jgi:hypothetical protein
MEQRELDIKEKWCAIPSQPDEKLKEIAKDIYNNLIYTDRHSRPEDISRRFMCLMMMGPERPSPPDYKHKSDNIVGKRENNIYDIIQRDDDQKKYEEDLVWYEVELKYYKEVKLKSIGMIYEYLSKASPMALNGGPMFFSLNMLNIEDAEKVWSYYDTYKEIREKADNF